MSNDITIDTKEAAKICGITPRNITEAVKNGRLTPIENSGKNGKSYKFLLADVQRFEAERKPFARKKSRHLQNVEIDPELQQLLPPLSDAEFFVLEQSCITDGIREPITLWNDVIIDGHNRYTIAKKT